MAEIVNVRLFLGDIDGDAQVTVADLLALLAAWGPCPMPPATCAADFDGSGAVDVGDLLDLLAGWGSWAGG